MKTLSLFLFLLAIAGCAPSSLDDFHHEGDSRCKALVKELQQIRTPEELLRAELNLKKHFESLVRLMIEARRFQLDHEDAEPTLGMQSLTSEILKEELRRIYAIEGGRAVIERAQQEALIVLNKNCHASTY